MRDGSNADESFEAEEKHAELAAAVLDLGAEDREGMAERSRQYHWDKRSKKYVQLGKDETVNKLSGKRIRTESGRVSGPGESDKATV